jgi:ubiquinone/menaquinone biosynthesis C-methylase UbiE/peptidoglycan/xylan/chitin deacetylase (PgdA/CDA1 family)
MDLKNTIQKNLFIKYPYKLNIQDIAPRFLKRKTAILMYHGFTDKTDEIGIENHQGKHLDISRFDEEMRYLKNHHNPISLPYFIRAFKDGRPIPDNSVIVTMDDGYESNYVLAYPILKRYGIPATIFITTDFVQNNKYLWVDRIEYAISRTEEKTLTCDVYGKAYSFDLSTRGSKMRADNKVRSLLKRLPLDVRSAIVEGIEEQLRERLSTIITPNIYRPLQWGQVREMVDSDLVTIGSHAHNHIALAKCKGSQAEDELTISKEIIETHTERICDIFCYPNGAIGDFNARTKSYLKSAGYLCGLINVPGFNSTRSDIFQLKRFGLSEDPSIEEFIMTLSGIAKLPGIIKGNILKGASRLTPTRQSEVLYKFDKGARSYSDKYEGDSISSYSFSTRRQKVKELIKCLRGANALDIGCGPGMMTEELTAKGYRFYGVDISENMIAECKKRFGHMGNASFSVGKAERLEFGSSFFDLVTCMGVVEYLDDDAAVVEEISRVLKPGGHVVITLPNRWSPYRLWHKVVCNKRLVDLAKRFMGRSDPTLIHREYTEEEYKRLLAHFGLEVEKTVYYSGTAKSPLRGFRYVRHAKRVSIHELGGVCICERRIGGHYQLIELHDIVQVPAARAVRFQEPETVYHGKLRGQEIRKVHEFLAYIAVYHTSIAPAYTHKILHRKSKICKAVVF